MENLPMLKGKRFGRPLGVPMPESLRKRILDLKNVYGVDHQEWARQLFEKELPRAEAQAKKKLATA